MKLFLSVLAGLMAFQIQAVASETSATINITSFVSLESGEVRNTGAELCGVVENAEGRHYMVEVVSDPNYKAPGNYMVIPNGEGKFCVVVSTQTGRAEARLVSHHGGDEKPATANAVLTVKK